MHVKQTYERLLILYPRKSTNAKDLEGIDTFGGELACGGNPGIRSMSVASVKTQATISPLLQIVIRIDSRVSWIRRVIALSSTTTKLVTDRATDFVPNARNSRGYLSRPATRSGASWINSGKFVIFLAQSWDASGF